jgi:hypothetical protein
MGCQPFIAFAATSGAITDTNLHPGFLKPYQTNSFTANQIIQYSCTNYQSGAWINLSPNYQILRTVAGSGATWTYTIQKDGQNGSTQLP